MRSSSAPSTPQTLRLHGCDVHQSTSSCFVRHVLTALVALLAVTPLLAHIQPSHLANAEKPLSNIRKSADQSSPVKLGLTEFVLVSGNGAADDRDIPPKETFEDDAVGGERPSHFSIVEESRTVLEEEEDLSFAVEVISRLNTQHRRALHDAEYGDDDYDDDEEVDTFDDDDVALDDDELEEDDDIAQELWWETLYDEELDDDDALDWEEAVLSHSVARAVLDSTLDEEEVDEDDDGDDDDFEGDEDEDDDRLHNSSIEAFPDAGRVVGADDASYIAGAVSGVDESEERRSALAGAESAFDPESIAADFIFFVESLTSFQNDSYSSEPDLIDGTTPENYRKIPDPQAERLTPFSIIMSIYLFCSGFMILFFGHRLFKPVLFVSGFNLIALIVLYIIHAVSNRTGSYYNESIYFVSAFVAGFMGGLLLTCIWRAGVFAVGSLLGYTVSTLLLSFLPTTAVNPIARSLLILATTIALGVAICFWERHLLVAATAVPGALYVSCAIDLYTRCGLLDAQEAYIAARDPPVSVSTGAVGSRGRFVALVSACVILAAVGAVVQALLLRAGQSNMMREPTASIVGKALVEEEIEKTDVRNGGDERDDKDGIWAGRDNSEELSKLLRK
ncbi:hypothetical protein DFJ73DRAFT_833681 [Zopfochytrium polystomum]|nr:hypothetical protein DFJ73DRAFT_833681 [Zopfochytrium polystomum]